MRAIRSLMEPLIRAYRLEPGLLTLRLRAAWTELVGSAIGAHSYPLEIQRDTLIILVDSSVWSQELSLLKQELLRRVNSQSDRPVLKQVRFRVGELPEVPSKETVGLPGTRALSADEASWAGDLTAALGDSELKGRIEKAICQALSRRSP